MQRYMPVNFSCGAMKSIDLIFSVRDEVGFSGASKAIFSAKIWSNDKWENEWFSLVHTLSGIELNFFFNF